MQFHIVRSGHAGCEPDCVQWIAAQGRIVAGTAKQFRKVLREIGDRKLPIFVDSGGGAVDDALAIGRLIRAKELTVAVTRTEFAPCAPADAACRKAKTGGELRGLARARMSRCASACAFILAGGTRRLVGQGTAVGVHQATATLRTYWVKTRRSFGVPVETEKTLVSSQKVAADRSTNTSIKNHLAEMGISDVLMSLILSTPGDRIRWLAPWELQATRLATHYINGEQLVTNAPAPASPPPPPPASAAVPELLGYQDICVKLGKCEQRASPSDPKLDPPANFSKVPNFLIPP